MASFPTEEVTVVRVGDDTSKVDIRSNGSIYATNWFISKAGLNNLPPSTEVLDLVNSVATSLIFKPPVANVAALETTYPTPSTGWAAMVQDVGFIYSYNGSAWVSTGLKAFPSDIPTHNKIQDALIDDKQILYAIRDANGDVLFAIFDDGTTTVDYTPPPSLNYEILTDGYIGLKKVLWAIVDANGDVIEALYDDGTKSSGDLSAVALEVETARGEQPTLNDRLSHTIKPYAIPTTPIWGGERLRRWVEWNRTRDYRYDWLLLGDSYTAGFYSEYLRKFLVSDGYPDGGAGWCSFSRFGTTIGTANGSINFEDLSFNYTPSQWDFVNTNTLGLNGHVVANAANAVITITATQLVSSITLVYEKHSGAGSFRYRVNTGSWTTVSTANATQTIGSTVIDTSSLTASFTVEVETLDTGIIFMGCIGRKSGNVLCLHKAGISGGNAGMMAQNQVWSDNAALTTPKGVAIMFGTNEMSGGTLPSVFRANLENIITKIRAIEPYCDILIMSPTYTKYETENPTAFSLDAYAQVAFEVAIKYEAAFINFSQGFGAFSQAAIDAGFMNPDRLHPGKPRGAKYMAELIVKLFK